MDTLMDNIMDNVEICWVDIYYVYDTWISVQIDSRYKRIYMDNTDNYMDMQAVSTWIYRMDMYVYLGWRSHLDIHGYAKWRIDM